MGNHWMPVPIDGPCVRKTRPTVELMTIAVGSMGLTAKLTVPVRGHCAGPAAENGFRRADAEVGVAVALIGAGPNALVVAENEAGASRQGIADRDEFVLVGAAQSAAVKRHPTGVFAGIHE